MEEVRSGSVPVAGYVAELGTSRSLPAIAVQRCAELYAEAGPLLREVLERAAADGILEPEDARRFMRSLYIVASQRDSLAFEPIVRLLHRPADEVDWLLSDIITEHLSRILIATFDGNADLLLDACVDLRLEEFVRDALIGAATFLTWEGRIERSRMVAFLERFERDHPPPDFDIAWATWATAISLLGLRDLAPTVLRVWDRDVIPGDFGGPDDFTSDLDKAEREPDDISRFARVNLGYIEELSTALAAMDYDYDESDRSESRRSEAGRSEAKVAAPHVPFTYEPVMPAVNPFRKVGRNDPCPCGSGKKAKRCCLAA